MELTDPGTTGVAEVIGGVETTTPSSTDSREEQHPKIKHPRPPGDPNTRITPHRMPADSTGSLANRLTTVGAQRVALAPGRNTVHHQEMDEG